MSITELDRLFDDVLSRAIAELAERRTDVFTFAFYHDHESAAVSICADTQSNSARSVASLNAFTIRHFADAVTRGDLRKAALFKANVGRSLSLGDFALINLARTSLQSILPDDRFYLSMIRSVRSRDNEIARMASDPQRLLFCSSSADDEVGYLWSAKPAGI